MASNYDGPQSWQDCKDYVNKGRNKTGRTLRPNVRIVHDYLWNCYYVRYYSTNIVTYWEDGNITLQTGGWATSSTKRHINSCTPPEIGVYQKNHEMFLCTPQGDYPFEESMQYNPETGRVATYPPNSRIPA